MRPAVFAWSATTTLVTSPSLTLTSSWVGLTVDRAATATPLKE